MYKMFKRADHCADVYDFVGSFFFLHKNRDGFICGRMANSGNVDNEI